MKILIVNDDSISAPGIAVLAAVASEFGEVTVVAPSSQCSAMSQKLTLRESMEIVKVEDFPADVCEAYNLSGTPVDCVKVALDYILAEKPDYVFSGINNGYNVGYDIAYSGTMGAALEAARNNIPAIAFSISGEKHLEAAEPYLRQLIGDLLAKEPDPTAVWNVNFPPLQRAPLSGILWDRPAAPVSLYREKYVEHIQPDGRVILTCQGIPTEDDRIPAGTDAEAVRKGYISIGRVPR